MSCFDGNVYLRKDYIVCDPNYGISLKDLVENIVNNMPISKGSSTSSPALTFSCSLLNSCSVGSLSNVDLAGIQNGDILKWNTGSSKFVASSDLGTKLNITAGTEAGGAGTVALTFSGTDTIYGTVVGPKTGTITTSITSAKVGVTHIVIHATGSLPTISAATGTLSKLSGSGNYSTTQTNVIFFTCIDANNVVYSINQI
jgi:hypothetical protein